MLEALTTIAVIGAVALAVLGVRIWRRQGTIAGLALAVVLVAVAWWAAAYALEISDDGLAARERWGDLKYVGITLLPAGWIVFVLDYTGRTHLVDRRLVLLLLVEPVLVWTALAIPATHDLVRSYPESVPPGEVPVAATGPLFWVHFAYSNALLVAGTVLLVASAVRLARTYRVRAWLLVAAALLPWMANILYNFEVGWFRERDLTPLAFVVAGGVLIAGLARPRQQRLSDISWHQLLDSTGQGLVLLDGFGRVVDANPTAVGLLGRPLDALLEHRADQLLPGLGPEAAVPDTSAVSWQVTLPGTDGGGQHLAITRQPLTDDRGSLEGALLVLRDVTRRVEESRRMEHLLAERTRIATTLQESLLPGRLPAVPGAVLASHYRPAGDGTEIGGDFFDVFALGPKRWGVVLGDVSGKGAEAAATTGLVRYTLRAHADPDARPAQVLGLVNATLLAATTDERYCTLVYGIAETRCEGGLRMCLSLAGHHGPLLRHAGGRVEQVGEPGTALGLVADPQLIDTEVVLQAGDLLCLFTDGLVEARRGGEWYDAEHVAQVLEGDAATSADAAVAAMVDGVEHFEEGPPADDLAILAVRAT